uniref:Ribonuclease H protein At1g65750 family n=1 Tax=Cajanus cajan TaxID=3821 RepID=A0A151TMX2_CAJCA|nr:Putative ribonuclease H protein At1g65750 family [Cajanus cajan]
MSKVQFSFCAGRWLYGFSKTAGKGDHILAELLAIKTGLSRCWEKGWKHIICESDCLEVTKVLPLEKEDHSHRHKHCGTIEDIRILLRKSWFTTIVHINRDANKVADRLASWNTTKADWDEDWDENWDIPPNNVLDLLMLDNLSIT